jgi:hypothetical protein
MKFKNWLEQKLNQEYTIIEAIEEIDETEPYYYLCKGNPQEVQENINNKKFNQIIVYETDEKINKSNVQDILYEVVHDFELSKKEIKKIPIHFMKVKTKMGEF